MRTLFKVARFQISLEKKTEYEGLPNTQDRLSGGEE